MSEQDDIQTKLWQSLQEAISEERREGNLQALRSGANHEPWRDKSTWRELPPLGMTGRAVRHFPGS